MTTTRFLWGSTKVDMIDFVAQTATPPAKGGRMYRDSDGNFRFCVDGTNFMHIRDVLHN